MKNIPYHTYIYDSPAGRLGIIFDNEVIIRIDLNPSEARSAGEITVGVATLLEELDDYFAGGRPTFTIPDIRVGTPFMRCVWKALTRIPYGDTVTYARLAESIGHPGAYRAVAQACKRNPYPIIIPCHRVVASGGGIGGYAVGIGMKTALLSLENNFK